MNPQLAGNPSPVLIFETMNAFERTAALRAAIELDVFTAIAEGSTTVEAISKRCGASERGIRILCDYLVIVGLLSKSGSGYALTGDSAAFLNRRSPAYVGGAVRFLNAPDLMHAWDNLTDAVRRGGTGLAGSGTVEADNPLWVEFAEGMAGLMAPAADALAALVPGGPVRVLDIAAGHGAFGIAVARRNPEAHIVAVDWQRVLEVARRNATKANLDGRYRTLPGDAFAVDFGSGYDAVLITNFLHHFSPEQNQILLRKVNETLTPGGRAIALEFVPNDDRVSPPIPAAFSLVMLTGTRDGDAYTFAEYQRMFKSSGFQNLEEVPLPQMPETLLVATKN